MQHDGPDSTGSSRRDARHRAHHGPGGLLEPIGSRLAGGLRGGRHRDRAGKPQSAARLRQGRQLQDLRRAAHPRRGHEAEARARRGPARGLRRRPHVHVQAAPGRGVQRRGALHRQGRRVHLPDHPRPEDQQRLQDRAGRRRERHRAGRRHGGLHPQVPLRPVRRADRTAHRPRARRGPPGRQQRRVHHEAPSVPAPYLLTGWSKGEKISFRANPRYWGGEPAVKKFTMAVVKDDDVRATRLRAGELDAAILPPNLARGFAQDKARKTFAAKTFDYRNVTLPTHHPVTGDVAVRRALDIAVDRQAMVDKLLDDAGKAAYGPVPTDSRWFTPGTERPYDLERAKQILDEAGWKPGGDGIRAKDGVRASFPLWYTSGDKIRQDHALAFASDAKKAGIEVKTEAGTWEVIEPRMKTDAVLAGGGSPADPDFDQYQLLTSSLAGDGFNNMAQYANPAVDRAVADGRTSGDPAARKAAYDTVQRELVQNPGYVFLTHIDHLYVVNDKWEGPSTQVEPHDHGLGSGPWCNVESWKPKQREN
ncbi:ABC transporter substrate-binding protein [Streptomyces sp. C]|nr:ABC transporter substrate-binding protein [Streptomyces sp. C]